MVQVATPEPLSATLPQPVIVLAPSEKATVPARLEPLTVAVKVTLWPTVEGLPEVTTVVVVEPVRRSPFGSLCRSCRCCWHRCCRWR